MATDSRKTVLRATTGLGATSLEAGSEALMVRAIAGRNFPTLLLDDSSSADGRLLCVTDCAEARRVSSRAVTVAAIGAVAGFVEALNAGDSALRRAFHGASRFDVAGM